MASTIARSIGSSAMSFTKLPSIFRKSTGRCLRYANEDIPAPKSSSEKRQPRARRSWMKCVAFARLAIAAVSVISKQSVWCGTPDSSSCPMTNARKRSSVIEAPEMLIAHVSSGSSRPLSFSSRSFSSALRTTQRSSVGMRLKRSAAGMNAIGGTRRPCSSSIRTSSSEWRPPPPRTEIGVMSWAYSTRRSSSRARWITLIHSISPCRVDSSRSSGR